MYQILCFYRIVLLGDCNFDLVFPKVLLSALNLASMQPVCTTRSERSEWFIGSIEHLEECNDVYVKFMQLCPGLITGEISAGYPFKTSCVSSVLQNCMDMEITSIYCHLRNVDELVHEGLIHHNLNLFYIRSNMVHVKGKFTFKT